MWKFSRPSPASEGSAPWPPTQLFPYNPSQVDLDPHEQYLRALLSITDFHSQWRLCLEILTWDIIQTKYLDLFNRMGAKRDNSFDLTGILQDGRKNYENEDFMDDSENGKLSQGFGLHPTWSNNKSGCQLFSQ